MSYLFLQTKISDRTVVGLSPELVRIDYKFLSDIPQTLISTLKLPRNERSIPASGVYTQQEVLDLLKLQQEQQKSK